MKYVGTAAACGLLASSSLAHAVDIPGSFSGNIGFASNYVWQGISMSAGNATVDGGFDWDSGQGWYVSIWGSNVDYYDTNEARYASFYVTHPASASYQSISSDDNATVEIDTYVGYWGYIGGGYNTPYDIGIGYYVYPGAKSNDLHYYSNPGGSCSTSNWATSDGRCSYVAWHTANFAEAYVGMGHYFLDDRVKTFAYLTFTNDYNGQNQDAWSLYDDTDVYLSNAFTLKLHGGYNWGQYWRKNLFGYNTNPGLSTLQRTWGWCGYTYAAGDHSQYDVKDFSPTSAATSRWQDCVNGSGKDDNWFDWSVGLSRSFGQFDVNVSYIWVTGIQNADEVQSWWAGMDKKGANEIYVDGKWVASIKMAL